MIADKILLVTREGWFSLAAGAFSQIPALPKLKGPTVVVADFDEAPVGIEGFVSQQSIGLHVRQLYCGPVMRHPAALVQAANFSSAI